MFRGRLIPIFRCIRILNSRCCFSRWRSVIPLSFRPKLQRHFGGFAFGFMIAVPFVAHCKNRIADRVNDSRVAELFDAVLNDDDALIDSLLKRGVNPNERHLLGWAPLHVAAFHGNVSAVKALLAAGADVDAIDEFTNVNDFARKVRMNLLEILFIRQEMFNGRLRAHQNYHGCTALHYAVLANEAEVINLLIKNGADPTVENDAGHVPADYAVDNGVLNDIEDYTKRFSTIKAEREAEHRRKYPLEEIIKQVLIGQEGAINTVASAIRRKESGWVDDEHPLVFLFLGSSGIGKTELAKQVAKYLHKNAEKGFVRVDMSEFQEKHEVAKFIGSPPGYVGHEDGGQLTKKLTTCPNAVVLFDEVEKAHPDILTIMLQLFDEGRLTDGKGQTIECKDAIFIMTSNLAAEKIADHAVQLRSEAAAVTHDKMKTINDSDSKVIASNSNVGISKQFKDQVVQPILKRHLKRDEFLGRITEMVYFLPFSEAELRQLVSKELGYWKMKARDKHNIDLDWNREVVDALAEGYNIRYGARSIKHEVERRVVNKLAAAHERKLISSGCKVELKTGKCEDNDPALYEIPIQLEVSGDTNSRSKILNIALSDAMLNDSFML